MTFKSLRVVGTALALVCLAVRAAAGDVSPHIDGLGSPATADAQWVAATEAKLAAFEKASGIRILIQFHPKDPPDNEDKNPGDYMRALSAKLGTISGGVLAVNFAGDPDWRVWIGDDLTPKFVGKPGTAKEFTESGTMHDAKEAMLNAAMAKAAADCAALQKSVPSGSLPPGALLDFQAAAIVDGVLLKIRK